MSVRFGYLLVFILVLFPAMRISGQSGNPFDLDFRVRQKTEPPRINETLELAAVSDTAFDQVEPDSEQVQDLGKKTLSPLPPVSGNPFDLQPQLAEKSEKEYAALPEVPEIPDNLASKGDSGNFLFWVLLIIILLLTVFINLNRSLPGQVYKAIFNENYLKYLQRSYTSDNRFLYLLFYFFFVLNGGIFIFLNIRYFTGQSDISLLFLCWLGLAGLYIVRHQFIRYIQYVYPLEKTFGVLNFSIMVYNVFLGMALLPVNVILAFSPEWFARIFLFTGIGVIIGLYLIRQLRAVISSLSDVASHPVHFFLYLCACEIMPLLIVGKFLYQVSQ